MAKSFLGLQKDGETMVKERGAEGAAPETVISIIGPGMTVVGDCDTDGTIRIDGKVQGTIRAGKAVVVGKDGIVEGEIRTQDAVVSGSVEGTLTAESRLELQSTCRIQGEIFARRMQLEEGAVLNGKVSMGDKPFSEPRVLPPKAASVSKGGGPGDSGDGSDKDSGTTTGSQKGLGEASDKLSGKAAGKP